MHIFDPKPDITAYELAIIVEKFLQMLARGFGSPRAIIGTSAPENLPEEVRRHFRPQERGEPS